MGNVIQCKTFQLQAPIGSTDTTIAVKNLETIYGDDVVMSGSIQYATLEPESQSNQEIISFTGITFVSTNIWNLTGVTRGLDAQPTNGVYGNDPAQGKAHASSVDCILSDSPQVWDDKASKSEDEEVTGAWTFDISPIVPTPDSTFEAANKDYVDNSVAAGASDSTTTTIGISRQSYSPTVTIGTATMTIASPCVVTFTSHGLTLNDSIQFTTTGALPTGLLPGTTYYVISAGLTANTFQIATTRGGTAINTTGSQSGTHTLYKTTPIAWNKNDPAVMTQTKYQAGAELYGTDVGGDDTYVVTLTPALTTYTNGSRPEFTPSTTNTGACTVDFGAGVLNIKTKDGNDPQSGVIRAGKPVTGTILSGQYILDNEDFATTGNKGVVEMATDSEAQTGTDTQMAITPFQLANANKTFVQPVCMAGANPYFSCAVGGFSITEPFFSITTNAGAPIVTRFIKRGDGSIIATHQASMTNASAGQSGTICVVGDYVYALSNVSGSPSLQRFDKADLGNVTNMTVSGTAMGAATPLFTDGTNIWNLYSAATARVYTISGTTVTSGTTRSYTGSTTGETYWCDGTNLWSINGTTAAQFCKWNFASGGARTTSTAQYISAQWKSYLGTQQSNYGGIMKDVMETSKLYTILCVGDATASTGKILPIDTF